jgi:hypothetical protein
MYPSYAGETCVTGTPAFHLLPGLFAHGFACGMADQLALHHINHQEAASLSLNNRRASDHQTIHALQVFS